MSDSFDYDRFMALDGLALARYIDPLLNAVIADDSMVVPREFLERLYSKLGQYDEVHLVYALELGGLRAPERFLPLVPSYLAHPDSSVSCAAVRVLQLLPDKSLTRELLNSVKDVLPSANFDKKYLSEVLDSLQKRLENKLTQGEPV